MGSYPSLKVRPGVLNSSDMTRSNRGAVSTSSDTLVWVVYALCGVSASIQLLLFALAVVVVSSSPRVGVMKNPRSDTAVNIIIRDDGNFFCAGML